MSLDERELIGLVVAEVGAPLVIGLIKKALDNEDSPISPSVAAKVRSILGEHLLSEVEYQRALDALRASNGT